MTEEQKKLLIKILYQSSDEPAWIVSKIESTIDEWLRPQQLREVRRYEAGYAAGCRDTWIEVGEIGAAAKARYLNKNAPYDDIGL